jgi:hypothetical protein
MHDAPKIPADVDQEIRINELREAAREVAGGEMAEWEAPDCPPHVAEQFWSNVLDFESAEKTCHFIQLEEAGIALPPPDKLSEADVHDKLWQIIHALAARSTFITHTNHLSDRELYEHLWGETLREITVDLPPDSGWTHHIDLVSSGSDEDNELYLKHFADEDYRDHWRKDFPDDVIPPHVDPPHDRDRHLPKPPEPTEFIADD